MIELEKIFKAVANRRRLSILQILKRRREEKVAEIARSIKLSLKSTSRHLKVLFMANIVQRDQRSSEAYYSLNHNLPAAAKIILTFL